MRFLFAWLPFMLLVSVASFLWPGLGYLRLMVGCNVVAMCPTVVVGVGVAFGGARDAVAGIGVAWWSCGGTLAGGQLLGELGDLFVFGDNLVEEHLVGGDHVRMGLSVAGGGGG